MADLPKRSQVAEGGTVSIETKRDQGTGKLTEGAVAEILTSSETHPHGIKVRLQDGQVGRVKSLGGGLPTPAPAVAPASEFEDLDKKEIPETEDKDNEFKEFYQYNAGLERINTQSGEGAKAAEGMISALERFATAVCSFGNSYGVGFVYLGIRSDGTVSGLEKDMKLGNFADYKDSFANHITSKLGSLLRDRVFIASKIQIRLRRSGGKTVCLVQARPADRPIYLHGNAKTFYVREASPSALKFDEDEQFKYIKRRFPDYG